MGQETGIKWTDSTSNPWIGCTKVEGAPACLDCYAEKVDQRMGPDSHWGRGAPRRRVSEHARNEPYRWQRNADKFFLQHGRRQRVFTLSMGDLFDNEVDASWRMEHMAVMQECDKLEWQICTKRVSQIPKMIPASWNSPLLGDEGGGYGFGWPKHIGVLITAVTQKEADRDVPRLVEMKKRFGIPWVGISYEPAQEEIDWEYPKTLWPKGPPMCCDGHECGCYGQPTEPPLLWGLDWIIFGGKSGSKWNDGPFDFEWARRTRDACASNKVAFFMKQAAAFQPKDAMIPADLMIRQWPKGH